MEQRISGHLATVEITAVNYGLDPVGTMAILVIG